MKFRSFKTENHPILQNLSLDFTNENGDVADTIILAGENGCGKSTILNILYNFSMFGLSRSQSDLKKTFEVDLTDTEITLIASKLQQNSPFHTGVQNNLLTFIIDHSIVSDWSQITVKYTSPDLSEHTLPSTLFTKVELKEIFNTLFSDVEINFTPSNIQAVTATDLDIAAPTSIRSTNNIATVITQLLIDIQALDDADFTQWARCNIGNTISPDSFDSRISRFRNAFNTIFENLNYDKIISSDNKKKVLFTGPSGSIPIEDLSSGEKQIVFRGGFLLKDLNIHKGSIILIDEPEISLHPKWQKNIMEFNKKLFTDNSGSQESQIFVSTHSPFIIHNNNRYKDKVIVLKKDNDGIITTPDQIKFYGWTESEIVQEAFNIDFNASSGITTIFVEGETDENYLNTALSVLNITDLNITFSWIGHYNNGNAQFTGDSALDKTKSFFLSNPNLLQNKIILLYDSDTHKASEDFNNLHIRAMPINRENALCTIGVENLLTFPLSYNHPDFLCTTEKTDGYSATTIINKLNKTMLCNYICNELRPEEQTAVFEKFNNVFEEIRTILNEE